MADLTTNTPVGKSLDEIAAMMTQSRIDMADRAAEKAAGRKPKSDATQLGDDNGEAEARQLEAEAEKLNGEDAGEGDAESEGAAAGVEDTEGGEGASEDGLPEETDDEGGEADGLEEFEFSDDDLVEIDGLEEPISFGALKERYTADETISATLAETKAFNETASQTMAKSQEDTELVRSAMTHLVAQVDSLLSQPLVEVPNEGLKTSNPGEYIRQVDIYNLDQKRINESRSTVTAALDEFGTKQKEFKETRRAHELGLLSDIIPDLKIDGKREAVSQSIVDAAKYYGFSIEEVKGAIDSRIYHMAHDAAKYHRIMAKAKLEETGETREEKARNKISKQPRLLRSRGTSARKLSSSSAKRIKISRAKAKSTGKTADVADFMAQNRQQK